MRCAYCEDQRFVCDGVLGDVVPCYVKTPEVRAALRARPCPRCAEPRAVVVPGVNGIPTAALK